LSAKALHFAYGEIQSRMQLQDPSALDLEYTRTMMGFLLFQPKPTRVAMIGLGGGSLPKFCHRYLPRADIRVVEINPHVIALRDEFHVPRDDARFRVVHGDGAHFVRYPPHRFDVLLVDGFDIHGLPAQLSSQRFYDDCVEALQPGGILVVNLHHDHPHYEAHVDRIGRSFDGTVLVVDNGEPQNCIVFARRGRALHGPRSGPIGRPRHLAPAAAEQLHAAFARIERTWRGNERGSD
ncbi:MAG TPA: fused MFS/spermidine synthase, partial [Burkholderiaceae bacterium]|nr:fused MFS/spermidine synthase [Burkholderiaceae bacterium]